jgi:tetratricopeptide (TPR) repeat protein
VGLVAATVILLLAGWAASHFLRSNLAPTDDAQSHWQKAQAEIAARDFSPAAEDLSLCLESWPYNAETHFLLARTSRRGGNFSQWKAHLSRAELLRWPKKQIDLERQLRRAQAGDVWDVETSLIDLLNQNPPEEVIILEALVLGCLENDRLIDVIALTTTWSNRYPDDWAPFIFRGNAELRLYGKSSNAAKDFQRVLELKPNDPGAHLAMAQVLANQGQFEEAMPHFEFCLTNPPDDPTEVLFGLASSQFSLGRIEEARASLEQLFAKVPNHSTGCFLRAKVELADGRHEEALRWFQKADALAPDESDITNALLQVCRQLGRKEDVDRYQNRLEQIRRRDEKLDHFLTLAKTRPEDPEVRYQLGKICLDRGRDQEATHWFQGILFKDPSHLPTLRTLAAYYQKKGKPKLAAYYGRKAEKAGGMAQSKSSDQRAPKSLETPVAK